MTKYKFLWILLFLFAVIFLISCERAAQEPFKIGLAVNLSGCGGAAGADIRNGAMLAVEEINDAGGINGRPLKLLIKDDKNSKEGVLSAGQELIEQSVIVVIGHSTSRNTLIAYPYITAAETLLFTPYTATSKLNGVDDLFCRTSVDNRLNGHALAALLTSRQFNNISFLLDSSNADFVEDYLEHTAHYFAGNINPVRFDTATRQDWERIITDLLQTEPEAIILLTEATMTGFSAQKLRNRGFQGELFATLWAQTPTLFARGGRAVEGMTLVTFVNPNNHSLLYQNFSRNMQNRFKRPSSARSVRGYEAVQIIAEALRQSPPLLTSTDLKNVLLAHRFETLMGTVEFDEFCDVRRPIYEVRIHNGAFYTVGTIMMEEAN